MFPERGGTPSVGKLRWKSAGLKSRRMSVRRRPQPLPLRMAERGNCPWCGRDVVLSDGLLGDHYSAGWVMFGLCEGTGKLPRGRATVSPRA